MAQKGERPGGRGLAIVGLIALLVPVCLFAGVGWVTSDRLLHPPRSPLDRTPADLGLTYEDLTLEAADGVTLAAWWIRARQPRGTVLLLHGYFHDRREVLGHVPYLHEAGYDVLMFDWRGHGASEATEATLGIRERQDLAAAVDEATRRSDGPIALLGYSMGAGTAILYAADDPRIRVLVLDSAYATIETSLDSAFTVLAEPKLPAFPFARLALLTGQLRTGLDPAQLRPVERVADLSGRPLLFIVGANDTVLPPDETRRLFAAAQEPKVLWEVAGAGHPSSGRESFVVAPERYREHVLATLESGLR